MPNKSSVLAHAFLMQFSVAGPATLEYVSEHWQNRLVPYGDIARHETRTTVSIRADGSRAMLVEERNFHHHFIQRDYASFWSFVDLTTHLFVRPQWQHLPRYVSDGWEVDVLTPRAIRPEPADCPPPGDRIAMYEHEIRNHHRQPDRTHLGFRVTVWLDDWGEEVWLAPRFYCAAVKIERVGDHAWGVPGEYSRQELTAIRYGLPDPKLFDPQRR